MVQKAFNESTSTLSLTQNIPPGFVLGAQVEPELVQKVLNFVNNQDGYQWLEDGRCTRQTLNYGWNYVKMEKNIYEFEDIPPVLVELRDSLVSIFSTDLEEKTLSEQFDNIIVTIYNEGEFLVPHYDADDSPTPLTKRAFHFEEPIMGVVIEADPETTFTFYYHDKEGRPSFSDEPIYTVPETPGATFLIQGPCRHAPYFHAIPPASQKRISVTLRKTILPKSHRKT